MRNRFTKDMNLQEKFWYYRGYYRQRMLMDFEHWWDKFKHRHPRFMNEGEATARVVNLAFINGYPETKDYDDLDDAVKHLQALWDIVDNWDTSRLNVEWAAGRGPDGGLAEWIGLQGPSDV